MSTNGSVHTSYQVEDVECNENQSPLLLSFCVTLEKQPLTQRVSVVRQKECDSTKGLVVKECSKFLFQYNNIAVSVVQPHSL